MTCRMIHVYVHLFLKYIFSFCAVNSWYLFVLVDSLITISHLRILQNRSTPGLNTAFTLTQ